MLFRGSASLIAKRSSRAQRSEWYQRVARCKLLPPLAAIILGSHTRVSPSSCSPPSYSPVLGDCWPGYDAAAPVSANAIAKSAIACILARRLEILAFRALMRSVRRGDAEHQWRCWRGESGRSTFNCCATARLRAGNFNSFSKPAKPLARPGLKASSCAMQPWEMEREKASLS
jgi:hypothetical protein